MNVLLPDSLSMVRSGVPSDWISFDCMCVFPSHYLCLCGYLAASAVPPVKESLGDPVLGWALPRLLIEMLSGLPLLLQNQKVHFSQDALVIPVHTAV